MRPAVHHGAPAGQRGQQHGGACRFGRLVRRDVDGGPAEREEVGLVRHVVGDGQLADEEGAARFEVGGEGVGHLAGGDARQHALEQRQPLGGRHRWRFRGDRAVQGAQHLAGRARRLAPHRLLGVGDECRPRVL